MDNIFIFITAVATFIMTLGSSHDTKARDSVLSMFVLYSFWQYGLWNGVITFVGIMIFGGLCSLLFMRR